MSNLNLIDQTCGERRSEQIVGISPSLKSALAEVERVAPTDASVLLLGETGTGKELVARSIHNLSSRSEHPFVKLDCAAIPFDLLDSELFGHEKGAFPWAVAHRIGRFEMADGGTLFLDEIGDLPPALQPKLLRILQEQEFERPGSSQTHRVNVRLIAATHRDLMGMISQGDFRSDLYYRLNGFPIKLPPLRDRREDIPLLVSHFVEMFSRRIGKQIHDIPAETLSAFTATFLARQRARASKFDRTRDNPVERRGSSESLIRNGQEVDENDCTTGHIQWFWKCGDQLKYGSTSEPAT